MSRGQCQLFLQDERSQCRELHRSPEERISPWPARFGRKMLSISPSHVCIVLYLQQSPSMQNLIEKFLTLQTGSRANQFPIKVGSRGGLGSGVPLSLLAICVPDAEWACTLRKAVHGEPSNNDSSKVSRLLDLELRWTDSSPIPRVVLCDALFASPHQTEQH